MTNKNGRPKIQFCPQGHDTFVTGRHKKSRKCLICLKEKESIRKKKYYKAHLDLMKERSKISHKKGKEKYKKTALEWRKNNPDKVNFTYRKSVIKRKYRLTLEQVDMIAILQDNKCAICKISFAELSQLPHIDHDHITGKIRGLLCSNCNTALGLLKDNIESLKRSISYLEQSSIDLTSLNK